MYILYTFWGGEGWWQALLQFISSFERNNLLLNCQLLEHLDGHQFSGYMNEQWSDLVEWIIVFLLSLHCYWSVGISWWSLIYLVSWCQLLGTLSRLCSKTYQVPGKPNKDMHTTVPKNCSSSFVMRFRGFVGLHCILSWYDCYTITSRMSAEKPALSTDAGTWYHCWKMLKDVERPCHSW